MRATIPFQLATTFIAIAACSTDYGANDAAMKMTKTTPDYGSNQDAHSSSRIPAVVAILEENDSSHHRCDYPIHDLYYGGSDSHRDLSPYDGALVAHYDWVAS